MKTFRVLGLMACVLSLAGVATADTVTIRHTMNYLDNDWLDGVWFVEAGAILDHSPYCRACNEDWGWTHIITDYIPKGATAIESATLTIIAWKIDLEGGEDDVIYALPEEPASTSAARTNGTKLGLLNSERISPTTVVWESEGQINNYETYWSTTTFDLPAEVLEYLWTTEQVCFYMDIDQTNADGRRATLESAILEISYTAPLPEVTTVNVYRFWSGVLSGHFYTASDAEANYVIDNYPDVWTYEGVAYRAMADDTDTMAVPVYRFWSGTLSGHFYTANEAEANYVIDNYPDVWTYEGIVFYVYPSDYRPADTYPVYRFWSDALSHHFYTISESDVAYIDENYSSVWTYEGVAWNAFMP